LTVNPANQLAKVCAYSTEAPEWEEFVRAATPIISLAVYRIATVWGDNSSATVMEIVQDVYLKLCEDERRILRQFEDRGSDSLAKILRVVSTSVATDYFRRSTAEKRGGRSSSLPLEAGGLIRAVSDSDATRAIEWPTLVSQLDSLLRLYPETVSERDRTLFWLYYRQGMTAEAISMIPAMGLGRKGVESALLRMTRLLQETIKRGKPKPSSHEKKKNEVRNEKGFSPVVAINSVKRR
jgi:RNA polymerase sigma-70 factor (ECF subfamily)